MKKSDILNLINSKKVVIGAIHFSPSPGFEGFDSVEKAIERAQKDLDALIVGGVDVVVFENNYDLPHHIKVGHETTAFMTHIISKLEFKKNILFGISVLWNDFESAFSIAKVTGGSFIRIPAFVDTVKTSYGIANAAYKEAVLFREKINGESIAIFADVQVKHAEMVDKTKSLEKSIRQAESELADGIIITGKWTGDAPILKDLKLAKKTTKLPIIVGSGANKENIKQLFNYSDAAIVSTSLKKGQSMEAKKNPNLKSFEQRMDEERVLGFMATIK